MEFIVTEQTWWRVVRKKSGTAIVYKCTELTLTWAELLGFLLHPVLRATFHQDKSTWGKLPLQPWFSQVILGCECLMCQSHCGMSPLHYCTQTMFSLLLFLLLLSIVSIPHSFPMNCFPFCVCFSLVGAISSKVHWAAMMETGAEQREWYFVAKSKGKVFFSFLFFYFIL